MKENIETVICSECNYEIKYVKGKRHKLSDPGLPQAVTKPDEGVIAWDGLVKCPECGKEIIV